MGDGGKVDQGLIQGKSYEGRLFLECASGFATEELTVGCCVCAWPCQAIYSRYIQPGIDPDPCRGPGPGSQSTAVA